MLASRVLVPVFTVLALGGLALSCATDDAGQGDGAGDSTGTSTADASASASTTAGSGGADSTGLPGDRYHPLDYAMASVHGPAMKLHEEDCRTCHGDDLAGGTSEVNCDSCHTAGWRTDCVFCHGGDAEPSGAPPRDIDGTTETSMLSFIAHTRHVTQYQHAPYDCSQCHVKPVDVLSSGHVFDDTDARAEVSFAGGISAQGVWDGNGGCQTLWCHGNGISNDGAYQHDDAPPTCGGCHPYPGTENLDYTAMSGQHRRHINEGIQCAECHDPLAIESHVDGKPDIAITAAGFSFNQDSKSCTGLCHLKPHNEHW